MIKGKDKLAITCHDTKICLFNLKISYSGLFNLINSQFEKNVLKSKIIIAVSDYIKEIINYYNIRAKIITIHNGII
jgi:hypothetical protein